MMPMPIEDSYVQIGSDTTRFWSTARTQYVPAGDATMAAWLASGRQVVMVGSEADLTETLVNLGLGLLAPTPTPPAPDPLAVLQQALITAGVLTQANLTAAATSLTSAAVNEVATPPAR